MTEKCICPICKGDVSCEARDHVFKEIGKFALDPKNYTMKIYDGDKEEDTDE